MLHFLSGNISTDGDFPATASSIPPAWRNLQLRRLSPSIQSLRNATNASATPPEVSARESEFPEAYERIVGMEFLGSRAETAPSANVTTETTDEKGVVVYFFTLLLATCSGRETFIEALRCSFSESCAGDTAENLTRDTEMGTDDAHASSFAFHEENSSSSLPNNDFLTNPYPDPLLEHLWSRLCAHMAPGSETLCTAKIPSSSSFVVLDRRTLFLQEGIVDIVHASLSMCEDDVDVMHRGTRAQSADSGPVLSSMPSSERASLGDGGMDGILLSFTERMNTVTAMRAMPECKRNSRRTFASLRRFVERERNKWYPHSHHEHDKQRECSLEGVSTYRYFVWVHVVGTSLFYEATVTERVSVPHDAVFNAESIPPMQRRNVSPEVFECGEATHTEGEGEGTRASIRREVEEEIEHATQVHTRSVSAATLSAKDMTLMETETSRCVTAETSPVTQPVHPQTTKRAHTTRVSGLEGTQCFGDAVVVPANVFCQSGYFLRSTSPSHCAQSGEKKNDSFTFYWLFACDYSRHGLQVKQVSYIPSSHNSNISTSFKNEKNNANTFSSIHFSPTSLTRPMKASACVAPLASHSMQNDALSLQSGKLDVRSAAQWTLAQYPQWHHWDPVTQRLSFWAAFPTFDELRIVAFDGHPDRRRCEFERNLTRRRRYMPDPLAGITHAAPLARGYGIAAEPFMAHTNPPTNADSPCQGVTGSASNQVNGWSSAGGVPCGHALNEAWDTAGASMSSRQHICLLSIRYEDGVTDLMLCEQFFATPSMHVIRPVEGNMEQEVSSGAPLAFSNTHETSNLISTSSDFSPLLNISATVGLESKVETGTRVPGVFSSSCENITPVDSTHTSQHTYSRQGPSRPCHHSTSTAQGNEESVPRAGHQLPFSQSVPFASRMDFPSIPQASCPPAIMCTITALRNYADALQLTIPLLPEERLRITYNTRVCFLAMNGLIAVYLPGVCVHYIDVHHKDVPPQYLFGVRLSSLPHTSLGISLPPLVASLPIPNGHWLFVPGTAMLFEARLQPTSVWKYIAHRLARRRAYRVMACGAPNKTYGVTCDSAHGFDCDNHTKGVGVEKVVLLHPALCAEAMDPAPLQHALHVALTHFPILSQARDEEGKHSLHRTCSSTVTSLLSSSSTTSMPSTSTEATSPLWSSSITPLLLEWETIWSKRDAQLEAIFRSFFISTTLCQEFTVEFISTLVMAEAYERTRTICHWRPSLSYLRSRRQESGGDTQWNYLGNPFFAALPLWDSDGLLAEDRRFRREVTRYYAAWRKHTVMHERESWHTEKEEEREEEEREREEEEREEEAVGKAEGDEAEEYKATTRGVVECVNSTSLTNERDGRTPSVLRTNTTRRSMPQEPLHQSLHQRPQQETLLAASDNSWDASLRGSLPNSLATSTAQLFLSSSLSQSSQHVRTSRQTQKERHHHHHHHSNSHPQLRESGMGTRRACESERRSALLSALLVRATSQRDVSVSRQQCHNTIPEWWLCRGIPPFVFSTSSLAPPHARLLFTSPSAMPVSTQGDGSSLLHKLKEAFRSGDKGNSERGTRRSKIAVTVPENNVTDNTQNNSSSACSNDWSNSKRSYATSAFSMKPVARMTIPLVDRLPSTTATTTGMGGRGGGGGSTGYSNFSFGRGMEPARGLSTDCKLSESNSNPNSKTSTLAKDFTPQPMKCTDATVHAQEPQVHESGKGIGQNAHHSSHRDNEAHTPFDGLSCGTVFVKSVLDQLHRICPSASHSSSGHSLPHSHQQEGEKHQKASVESFVSSGSSSLLRFLSPVSVSSVVSWVMSPADVRKSAAAQLAILAFMYDAAMASVVNLLVRVANTESFAAEACASGISGDSDTAWSALHRWKFLQSLALALNRIGVPLSQELTTSLARNALAKLPVPLLLSAPRCSGTVADLPLLFRHSSSLRSEFVSHIKSFAPHEAESLQFLDASQQRHSLPHDIVTPYDEVAMAEAISQSLRVSSCTLLESSTGKTGYCDAHSPILSLHGAGLAPEFMERTQLCRLVTHSAPTLSCTRTTLREWKWHLKAALDPGPFLQHEDERSIPLDTEFASPFTPFQLWWKEKKGMAKASGGKSDRVSVPLLWPSMSSSHFEEPQRQRARSVKENEETREEDMEKAVCIPQLLAETSLGHIVAKKRAKAAMAYVLDPFFKSD